MSDFVFVNEHEPMILTVVGEAKSSAGAVSEFIQSFKIAPRSIYSDSLVSLEDLDSIVAQYEITHTRLKLAI